MTTIVLMTRTRNYMFTVRAEEYLTEQRDEWLFHSQLLGMICRSTLKLSMIDILHPREWSQLLWNTEHRHWTKDLDSLDHSLMSHSHQSTTTNILHINPLLGEDTHPIDSIGTWIVEWSIVKRVVCHQCCILQHFSCTLCSWHILDFINVSCPEPGRCCWHLYCWSHQ